MSRLWLSLSTPWSRKRRSLHGLCAFIAAISLAACGTATPDFKFQEALVAGGIVAVLAVLIADRNKSSGTSGDGGGTCGTCGG